MSVFSLRRRLYLTTILVLLALFVAACGGSDDDKPPSPTAPLLPTTTQQGSGTEIGAFPTQNTSTIPTPTRFAGFPTLAVAATIPANYPESIQIVSPTTSSLLQGNISVFGSASHPDFVQYALEYGPDPNPNNLWYPITPQAVTTPVINNALGAWNTSLVPDGSYQIRLHLYLTGGRELTSFVVGGLQVRNQQGGLETQVAQANTPPVINPVASLNLAAGTSTTIALGIFDANNDPVTFTATSDNTEVAVVTSGGQAITVTALSSGIATIRIEVSDNRGGQAQTSFLVNVPTQGTTNRPPNISAIPSQVITVGAVVSVPVTISDAENDAFDFSVASSDPAIVQASKGATNQSINLAGFAAGTTTITITAQDAQGQSSQTVFSVVVNPAAATANNPPSIAAIPSQTLLVGELLELSLSISDPDGDSTTFTVNNSDQNVLFVETLQNNSIRLAGMNAGQSTLTVIVRDEHGSSITTQLNVQVSQPPSPNQPPSIQAIPAMLIQIGELREVPLVMTDPDGDDITFSTNSEDASLVTTGPASANSLWVLGAAEGTTLVTVAVGDGQGGSTSTTFNVTVNSSLTPNQLPSIDEITATSLDIGQTVIVPITYTDPDEDSVTVIAQSDTPSVVTAYQSNSNEITLAGVASGEAVVTVTVDDGRGGAAYTAFNVTVLAANRAPSIAPIASQACVVGDNLELQLAYNDPDEDAVNITVASDNSAIASIELLNQNTLQLTCVASGDASITVQGDDGRGGINTVAFLVSVSAPNQAPTMDELGDLSLSVGETQIIPLSYTDPDGDSIVISPLVDDDSLITIVVQSPTELELTALAAGTAQVTVTIDDGRGGTASADFSVEILAANQAPVIEPIAPLSLTIGQSETLNLQYNDADGDELSLTAISSDESIATVAPETATSLLINGLNLGSATILVTIDDGQGGVSSTEFIVTVSEIPNQQPTIEPLLPVTLTVDESVLVNLIANDPDGDPLTTTAASDNEAVATAIVNSATELSVTAISAGTATITVTVDDGRGGIATSAFSVEVSEIPNQQPTIELILPVTLTVGESALVNLLVNDPDGDILTTTATSDNEAVAVVNFNSPSELSITAISTGTATITVTVDDGRGGIATSAFSVEVAEIPNQQPTIEPLLPANLTVGESALVNLVANDPDGDPLTTTAISDNEAVAAVAINSATELSVTAISAGNATITVTVDDGRGGIATSAFSVNVAALNQQPTIEPLLPVNLNVGESALVNLVVNDPDGDVLTTTATSDSEGIATVTVNSPTELSVTAISTGTATITVTIDDGRGGIATSAFSVEVAEIPNQQPTIEPILPVNLNVGESALVSLLTNDPDGDILTTTAASDNEGIAVVTVNSSSELSVTAISAGSATITVTVDDGRGGIATSAFSVEVAEIPNQQPTIEPLLPVTLTVGESALVNLLVSDPDGDTLTTTALSDNEAVAVVTVNAPSELSITANASGTATITVTVDDGRGGIATSAFSVEVSEIPNQQPTIEPILPVSLNVDESALVNLIANDPDGDPLTTTAASDNEAAVVVTVNSVTELSITAISAGTATITVTVDDGRGGIATSAFSVEVAEIPNQQPTIEPILPVTLTVGESALVNLLANDPDGDILTTTAASDSEAVAIVLVNSASSLSVTAISSGTATITVTVDDGHGGIATSAFSVNVEALNQQPTIEPILPVTLTVGESALVNLLANDPDGDTLTTTATSDNEGIAAVTVNSASELTVTAISAGTATITVMVDDGRGGIATSAFSVEVTALNQQPTIEPILPVTLTVGESALVNLLTSDPDGDPLTTTAASDNEGIATVTVNSSTELSVTAISAGTATITLTVDDGRGGIATSAFSVEVSEIPNQQPSIEPILPVNLNVGESALVNVLANDPDGDILTTTAISDNEGIAAVTVNSATELSVTAISAGTATITVTVDDGRGGIATSAFSVEVLEIPNQQPTIEPLLPVNLNVGESALVNLLVNDPDGDVLTTTAASDNEGIAAVTVNSATELSVTGISAGTATITVTVDDGRGGIATSAFSVEVAEIPNRQPTIEPLLPANLTVGESALVNLLATDPDGDPLTTTAASDNEGVAIVLVNSASSLSVTAVSAGTATITVTVDDGRGGIATSAFSVEVTALNQQPTIEPLLPVTLTVGDSPLVTLIANDPDGDVLTTTAISDNEGVAAVIVNSPSELSITAISAGTSTITVTVDDGRGGIATSAFSVEVAALNQQPTIEPLLPVTLTVGESALVNLLANDPDGDTLTTTATSDNEGVAIVLVNSSSELSVTAISSGTATITVTVDDGRGGIATSAFSVNVAALNQQPTIEPLLPVNLNVGESALVNVLANDPDGDILTTTATSDNEGVAIVLVNSASSLSVTAISAGNATITVTVDDGRGGIATSAFSINVAALNQQPTIEPLLPVSLNVGDSGLVNLLANDPDGDTLTTTATSDNEGVAIVLLNSASSLSVTAISAGNATITVTVDDGRGGIATSAFSVNVAALNQLPFIDAISPINLNVGESATITLNYGDADGDTLTVFPNVTDSSLATVSLTTPNQLAITAFAAGTTSINVLIDDGRGGNASTSFDVIIQAPSMPIFDVSIIEEVPDFEVLYPDLISVYSDGINNLGRNPNAFSFAGDDSLSSETLLDPIALGQYAIGNIAALQTAIDYYNFDFQSLAYGVDWTIENMLDPAYADPNLCQAGETPFECELRSSAPVVIFINFTPQNALATPLGIFQNRLEEAVDLALDAGTIPVLVTLPNDGTANPALLADYNLVIYNVATQHSVHPDFDVPLWNLYVTLEAAPQGIYQTGGFGPADYSPAALSFGVNRRGAVAIFILEKFRETFAQ